MEDRIRSVVVLLIFGTVAHASSDPFAGSVVQPKVSCPPGYEKYNSQCVSSHRSNETAHPIIDCPPGFTMTSTEMCEKSVSTTDIKMPTFECPNGYESIGHSCFSRLTVNQQCPSGYNYDGKGCVKITPICPGGYSFSGDMCWPENKIGTLTTTPIQRVTHPCPYAPQPCGQYTPCQTQIPPVGCVLPPPVPHPVPHPIAPIYPPTVPTTPIIPLKAICPPGYEYNGVTCVAIKIDATVVPPTRTCPPGFLFKNGQCIKFTTTDTIPGTLICPEGFVLINGWCHRPTEPVPRERCCGSPERCCESRERCCDNTHLPLVVTPPGHEIERNVTIHVHTPINVPTNINNVNNQTIIVHPRTSEKQVSPIMCPSPPPAPPSPCVEDKEIKEEPKCCEVVSPRICKRKYNKSWHCYHRKTEQCGGACTGPQIHLRPPRPVYQPTRIVMVPQPVRPPTFYTPPNDCSSCSRGYCPTYCHHNECESTGSCSYVNQEEYCGEYGGPPCSEDFGCMGGGYCA